ncbi:MAG: hypothetical protein E7291_07625 [Lachnospiraceae bacterium]|nr:hypothetical protein [Lachnospiraceae bacterium]
MRFPLLERFHYWWLGGRSITRSIFRMVAAWQGVGIISTLLIAAYVMASFYTQAGEFVIRVDHAGEKRLVLSDTPDFPEELLTLTGTAIPEADNISIFDIDRQVAQVDGDHNGPDYVAYTFYVKNVGYDPITYNYSLSIRRATKGIEEATWVMLYHNGEMKMLAAESQSGGAEKQHSEYEFPFQEALQDPEQYTYNEQTGIHTITTKPFEASNVVATGERAEIQAQEIDKFTVVIWLEGEDPECINDILGGSIEMIMKFRY